MPRGGGGGGVVEVLKFTVVYRREIATCYCKIFSFREARESTFGGMQVRFWPLSLPRRKGKLTRSRAMLVDIVMWR